MKDLKDKRIIITGATGGIGNSIVDAEVVKKPFYDPNKSIAKNSNI